MALVLLSAATALHHLLCPRRAQPYSSDFSLRPPACSRHHSRTELKTSARLRTAYTTPFAQDEAPRGSSDPRAGLMDGSGDGIDVGKTISAPSYPHVLHFALTTLSLQDQTDENGYYCTGLSPSPDSFPTYIPKRRTLTPQRHVRPEIVGRPGRSVHRRQIHEQLQAQRCQRPQGEHDHLRMEG